MDTVTELSLKEKVKLLAKILLLAQVAESYSENKKVLGYVKKTVVEEGKTLKKGELPLVDEDSRSASKLIAEFADVLTDLIKAKKIEDWKPASEALNVYIEKLTSQLLSDERLLVPQSKGEPDVLSKVINSAASGVRRLSAMLEKGVDHLKKEIKESLMEDNK